jgi:heme/copper-type cytochrome/quinol oxidase subunit 3
MSETLFDQSGFIARVGGGYPLVDNSRFVFMIALAVDVMFFAVLIGAFFVLREGAPSWPTTDMLVESPRTATAIAICLLASSIFLSLTVRAQHFNRLKRFRTFLSAALLFLAIALTFSIAELRSFLGSPGQIHAVFAGLFMSIIALFILHITAAFGYIIAKYRWTTLRWRRYTRSGVSLAHLTSFVTAMLIVWVGIFAVAYL